LAIPVSSLQMHFSGAHFLPVSLVYNVADATATDVDEVIDVNTVASVNA